MRSVENSFILGCSGLAGLYQSISEQEIDRIISLACRSGIIKFDTAPHYGCGLGEERLGQALAKVELDKPIELYTKVGRLILPSAVENIDSSHYDIEYGNLPGPSNIVFPDTPLNVTPVFDYSTSGVQQSYADSLRRLGVPSVFGLRLHDFDDDRHFPIVVSKHCGGLQGLIELRNAGSIQDVGIGVNSARTALKLLDASSPGEINTIMLANSWNLLHHPIETMELFNRCKPTIEGSGPINIHLAGIFASGALVGRDYYNYSKITDTSTIDRIRAWKQLCEVEYDLPLPLVAFAFALIPHQVDAIAVGVSSESELVAALAWFQERKRVPSSLWHRARDIGLLASHVPLPTL